MAKQLVNPFERHVEKLVLAIAGLLLIGVLVKFVFSSPNKVPLGQETATPGSIDGRLAQKATEILNRIQIHKPQAVEHDPKFDEFVASLAPIKPQALPVATAIGPFVPIVDEPGVATGRATLVEIPAAPKPQHTLGRNTLLGSNPQGGNTRTPIDWVMLAIPFDVKAVSDLQRRVWGATQADVIFATPEVQRRMRKKDGSWSESDWETITLWPSYKMPDPPTIRLTDEGGKILANTSDQRAVEKYREEMANPLVQLSMLRPLPPNFAPGEQPWKFPLITTYENVVKQDQQFLNPNNPTAPVEDRYGLGAVGPKPKVEPKTLAQAIDQELEDARAQMETGRKLWSKNDATLAYNRAIEVSSGKDATSDQKSRAQKLMKEAEQLIVDIQRNPEGPPGRPLGGPKLAEGPKTRDQSPQQDVWAYDAAAGSIINGETYQYRMRGRVLNRLAGIPDSFADPKDAQVVIVAGKWSEPTDPIHIAEDSWYFVTRDDKNKREVYLEFFRWFDGVWVKSSAAKFTEGEAIFHLQRVSVPDLQDRSIAVQPSVEFGEDLALLDIEFARPLRARKSGSSKEGVRFAAQTASETAAVFVDGKGRLQERIVAVDKENPLKRKIEVWSPSKRAAGP